MAAFDTSKKRKAITVTPQRFRTTVGIIVIAWVLEKADNDYTITKLLTAFMVLYGLIYAAAGVNDPLFLDHKFQWVDKDTY